jgi:hypothetical protein
MACLTAPPEIQVTNFPFLLQVIGLTYFLCVTHVVFMHTSSPNITKHCKVIIWAGTSQRIAVEAHMALV